MIRSNRIRAGILMGAAALAMAVPAVAKQANLVYIAGYFTDNQEVMNYGGYVMAVGAAGAGTGVVVGAVSAPTGVGAVAGASLVAAGTVTAGIGG